MNSIIVVLSFVAFCIAGPPPQLPDISDDGFPIQISADIPGIPDNIDAAFYRISINKIYVFSGTQYWRISDKVLLGLVNDTVDTGYPQNIVDKWSIPGPIDAVFQRSSNGKIYIFAGGMYWRFTDKYLTGGSTSDPDVPDANYPKNIADRFTGIPDNVDSAFYRANQYIYFFKGTQYYRIADKYYFGLPEDVVDPCYPKDISASWINIPNFIDAVYQTGSDDKIIFFKGTQYYQVTDKYLLPDYPDVSDDGFPSLIQRDFLQCTGDASVPTYPDAVFYRKSNSKIYVFQGSLYWRISDKYMYGADNDCVDPGYPKDIATNWLGVPNNLDAAFYRENGHIYFFQGSQYFRVSDKYLFDLDDDVVDSTYPKPIATNFIGIPNNIDSAFQRTNGYLYFFKGSQYYRIQDKYLFDHPQDVVDTGYPQEIDSKWWGMADGSKGTFERFWVNYIYSFNGEFYTRFTDKYTSISVPCFAPAPPCQPCDCPVCPTCEACTPCEACEGCRPCRYDHHDDKTVINFNFEGMIE